MTGLDSVGNVSFDWGAYNPTGGSGTLNVSVGSETQVLTFATGATDTYRYDFDTSDETQLTIAPESGSANGYNRINLKNLTITPVATL